MGYPPGRKKARILPSYPLPLPDLTSRGDRSDMAVEDRKGGSMTLSLRTAFGQITAGSSIVALALASAAHALPPDQIFERAAPGLWLLRMIGADSQAHSLGSAVAIAAGKAVTGCALLPRDSRLVLQRGESVLAAKLEFSDAARDLCQLDVPGLQAQEPPRAEPRMGQRVYAIGYERGNELAIAEGLISRVREAGSDGERIQTSVPTSGSLVGAGLYDDEARLLGVTTVPAGDASRVVFAAPARWIAEIAGRGRAPVSTANARPREILPAPGASWTYGYALSGLGAVRYNFTVRVTSVEGGTVQESLSIASAPASQAAVRADSLSFRSFPLPRSQTLVEFAPYLHTLLNKNERISWGKITGYPAGNAAMPFWTLTASNPEGEEQVAVPAGTFKATKIEVRGRRQAPVGSVSHLSYETTRFVYRAWYAPEARRYVKLQHETWSLNGQWSGEQKVELLSYSDK
jgi:hypothetical protein